VLNTEIDWLSRPALASVLRWKPVAVMGASTGRGGTRRAQQQVRDALLYPGAIVLEEPEVALPVAWEHFDEDGRLVDEKTRDSIRGLLEGLVAAPRAQQRVSHLLLRAAGTPAAGRRAHDRDGLPAQN
jgi:chromate reductase